MLRKIKCVVRGSSTLMRAAIILHWFRDSEIGVLFVVNTHLSSNLDSSKYFLYIQAYGFL